LAAADQRLLRLRTALKQLDEGTAEHVSAGVVAGDELEPMCEAAEAFISGMKRLVAERGAKAMQAEQGQDANAGMGVGCAGGQACGGGGLYHDSHVDEVYRYRIVKE